MYHLTLILTSIWKLVKDLFDVENLYYSKTASRTGQIRQKNTDKIWKKWIMEKKNFAPSKFN